MHLIRLSKRRLLMHTGIVLLTILFSSFFGPSHHANGQSLPTLDFSGRPTDTRPELLDSASPASSPSMQLPPPAATAVPEGSLIRSVFISRITVTGSTVFSAEELAEITALYEGRTLTITDLETLRRELTLLYVNRGYVNSGAIIPDQDVDDGLLRFTIIEGTISDIRITGTRWFTEEHLRDRIALDTDPPVSVTRLQNRLQLLQQDDRLQLVRAELRPGDSPGEGELQVQVEEKPAMSFWFGCNNYQSPSIGAERGLATFVHRNLRGHGDTLSLTYGYSSGINPLLDLWYAFPINAHDTTLIVRYRQDDSVVIDKVFADLNIESTSNSYEFSLRHPLYRSLSQEFALAVSFEHERNETSLLGEPFSFAPGVDNGEAMVVPIRFAQEWTYRSQQQVLALRSRFSWGTKAFDATANDDGRLPDGQFFAWLGQVQWAKKFVPSNIQLLARADVQFAADPLLPVEQMAIGGRYSVRGYRENFLVRDEGLVASLEVRLPLVENHPWADYLQLVPFLDYGRSRSNFEGAVNNPGDLSSVGLGARWGATPCSSWTDGKIEAELYWGHQLRQVEQSHEDLQDEGIHFQIAMTFTF